MKSKLIFLLLLIVSFSCGTNNKPVSDAQKEKIKGDVKEVVNMFIKGCEDANFDMVLGTYIDSPDFIYQYNGYTFTYKEGVDAMKSGFSTLINQKCTTVNEKYAVLDNSTVLYSSNSKWLMNFKDGHSILSDPWSVQLLFKKIDNSWRVINAAESGVNQSVPSETSNELNHIEFMQQFLGTWKAEYGKDTILNYNARPFGKGSVRDWTLSTKGKVISSAKVLFGYDSKSDKMIQVTLYESSPEIDIWAWRATSKNTSEGVPLKDITNPDYAVSKMTTESKSPDVFIMTNLVNNKVVGSHTWTRIKK